MSRPTVNNVSHHSKRILLALSGMGLGLIWSGSGGLYRKNHTKRTIPKEQSEKAKMLKEYFTIAERFKIIRKYYGLSQANFAQRINMTPGFISSVEIGRSNVSPKTVDAVCKAFPIDWEWLATGTNSLSGKTGEGAMFADTEEHYPVDKEGIAARVKAVRKHADLTQMEFGKKIGYSKMQIHSVENGKVTPSHQFLKTIVKEFGVNETWILTGNGEMLDQGRLEAGKNMKAQKSMKAQRRDLDHKRDLDKYGLDDQLIKWLKGHPEVIEELRKRSGLDVSGLDV